MGNLNSIFQSPLGVELEGELLVQCESWFKSQNDEDGFQPATGTVADKFEGTDACIWGVPCDFTYNFSGKDHMHILPGEVNLYIGTVRFGVRTGNSHCGYTKFEKPVLVIGIDGLDNSTIRTYMVRIAESFRKALDRILDIGQSGYWDWCDAHGVYF